MALGAFALCVCCLALALVQYLHPSSWLEERFKAAEDARCLLRLRFTIIITMLHSYGQLLLLFRS